MAADVVQYSATMTMTVQRDNGWYKVIVRQSILLSIALWFIALISSQLSVGKYGLIQSLPADYLVATTLLTVSFVICLERGESNFVRFVHVLILIMFLYATPSLIEQTPRYLPAYHTVAESNYVMKSGHSFGSGEVTYGGWPGLLLWVAEVLSITGLDSNSLMLIFSTTSMIILFIPGLLLLRWLTGSTSGAYLSMWLVYLMAWFQQQYLIPQTIGLLLFVFTLTTLALVFANPKVGRKFMMIPFGILTVALLISHSLSALMLLPVIVATLFLASMARAWGTIRGVIARNHMKSFLMLATLLRLALILLAIGLPIWYHPSWSAGSLCFNAQPSVCLEFLRVDRLITQVDWFLVVSAAAGRSQVLMVRIVFLALYTVLFLSGLAFAIKSRKGRPVAKKLLFGWLLAVVALPVVTSYAGEALLRAVLFGLIPSAAVVAAIGSNRILKIYLVGFLLVGPGLHIVADYGNQAIDYIRRMELREGDFLVAYGVRNTTMVALSTRVWQYKDLDVIRPSLVIDHEKFMNNRDKYRGYFWISEKDIETWYHVHGGNPGLPYYLGVMTEAAGYTGSQVVYSNGYSKLYSRGI